MAKMWAGRFQKETDAVVNDFNSSVMFDCRMYAEDIQGSIAHATMLGRQGIIPKDDVQKIIEGLQGILADIEAGKIHFSPELYEDIHMANEQLLTERIGDAGKRLHTARSRNDQVALDMRLYVRREIKEIRALVLDFMHALCEVAAKHTETVMPGYTVCPRKSSRGARGNLSSSSWMTHTPPARPSCPRRKTQTSASSSAARPAAYTVR